MSTLIKKEKGLRSLSFLLTILMLVSCLAPFISMVSATDPNAPSDPSPSDGGVWDYFIQNTTLSCLVTDPDGNQTTVCFYLDGAYLGENSAVDNDTYTFMNIGFTPVNYTTYYWHVTVNDGTTNVTGPTWIFKGAGNDIDVDQNGIIDQNDYDEVTLHYGETGTNGWIRADVNNNGIVNTIDLSAVSGLINTTYMYAQNPPTSVTAVALNTTAINLSWVKGTGADATVVMMDTVNYSHWYISNGTEIYNGTGTNYVHDSLSQDTTYYYAFWTYNATEAAYYPIYTSDVKRSLKTGVVDVPLPTSVVATPSYALINFTWSDGLGVTNQDNCLIYYDIVNYTGWTRSNGTLLTNTSNLYYDHTSLNFSTNYYYALFSYNSTYNSYSPTAFIVNVTTLANPALDPYNFTATKINDSCINLSWSLTPGVDSYYVEYCNDTNPSSWVIGSNVFLYNGTNLNYSCQGLNPNRRYWYKAWGYNATYNSYSTGIITSAKTDMYDGVVTIGDNPNDIVTVYGTYHDEWVNHIYPSSWKSQMYTWWESRYGPIPAPDTWKEYNLVTFKNYVPYSWWNYWINGGHLGSPDTTHFNDDTSNTGSYCWHRMKPSLNNEIETNYTKPIYGSITGIGIYMPSERKGTNDYGGLTFPFDPRNYPISSKMDDVFFASAFPRIHIQINDQVVQCSPQDGIGAWYGEDQFLYWDLTANDCQIKLTNEPMRIEVWFEKISGMAADYFVETTSADFDGDGYKGFAFSSGADALTAYNDVVYSQKEDTARQFNYFVVYDPNLGSPGDQAPGNENTTFSSVDTLIIDPPTLGQYEQVNVIYLLNSTLYTSYLNVYNATGDNVYNKTINIGSGNAFFTPLTSGVFTVNITRQGIETIAGTFSVYAQSPHGYIWCDRNPVLKSDMFNVHIYYDIVDYPAILRLYDENENQLHQWTVPNNRTENLYDFTYQMTSTGKFYLRLYQQRTWDEQMITQYILWVKDREYTPSVEISKVEPRVGDTVTISITQNVVGTSSIQLKYWSYSQSKFLKIDNIGEKYVFSYPWTVPSTTGRYDIRMVMTVTDVGIFNMANISINVLERLPSEEETAPEPIVNIPNLLNQGGRVLGLNDPMFKLILGSLLVLFFMLSPLILAWRFKLKFADRILTNPMIYAGTAIIGSLISFALGLFELWVFLLIMIVALTFFIRAWRGHQQSAGDN